MALTFEYFVQIEPPKYSICNGNIKFNSNKDKDYIILQDNLKNYFLLSHASTEEAFYCIGKFGILTMYALSAILSRVYYEKSKQLIKMIFLTIKHIHNNNNYCEYIWSNIPINIQQRFVLELLSEPSLENLSILPLYYITYEYIQSCGSINIISQIIFAKMEIFEYINLSSAGLLSHSIFELYGYSNIGEDIVSNFSKKKGKIILTQKAWNYIRK